MKQPARFLFALCLTTMLATASNDATAADSEAPSQVLVQLDVPDKVLSAHWTRLPDGYVLRVVIDQPATAARTVDPPTDTPAPAAVTNPITTITKAELDRLGISNIADALTQLVPQNIGGYMPRMTGADGTASAQDRAQFFIGNTIANLRGMDPAFGCRTLTLVDGRRVALTGQQPPPLPPPSVVDPQVVQKAALMHQPYPPRCKDPRIDIWLLKSDGTQILPATYSCEWGKTDPAKVGRRLAEISYEFPLASTDQAVAAAIRIEDRFFIEKLQLVVAKVTVQ